MNSNKSFPPAAVGDTIQVHIPEIDRVKVDPQNALFVVVDVKDNQFYMLANEHSKLPQAYTRSQFTICPAKLLTVDEVS